ncbi:MAG: low molecular weight phosphotyrosine protein phosphatase [Atopobiaceae bacterium]|nr:low molecular weight phosphotyrosine protein phosphatase [Atopobiaceae bacterium]
MGRNDATRILFVCHGNICRSTMAEYVMRHLVREAGLEGAIVADSAAATRDALGWGVHPGTQEVLRKHGVSCGGHRSRAMTRADYGRYDLIVGMDEENRRDMLRILGSDPKGKVRLLLDWTARPREIDDPWYTDDYDTTYDDVRRGCEALLAALRDVC